MKKVFMILLSACLLLSLAACRSGTQPQVYNGAVPPIGKEFTAEDMRIAIVSACTANNWRTMEIKPGLLEATILVRGKHTVTVSIPYDEKQYSIKYKESANMEYKEKSDGTQIIHPNYNNWVARLDRSINDKILEMKQ